jgi:hypothetical protein
MRPLEARAHRTQKASTLEKWLKTEHRECVQEPLEGIPFPSAEEIDSAEAAQEEGGGEDTLHRGRESATWNDRGESRTTVDRWIW